MDKWVWIHIGNSSAHIGQTHSRFPKKPVDFDNECKAHQIDILDILLIKNYLTNTPSTSPPEGKEKHLTILCTSTETSIC